jgi:hypothetical protein
VSQLPPNPFGDQSPDELIAQLGGAAKQRPSRFVRGASKVVDLLPTPTAAEMAREFLHGHPNMIFDHYAAAQGRRVLRMSGSEPLLLLEELWRANRRLNVAAALIAEAVTGKPWNQVTEVIEEMIMDAYHDLYPAVETPTADEMTVDQRESFVAWLHGMARRPD